VSGARVISLVPSASETLLAWGIEPAAVTRFCEQPTYPSVGGTKDPDIDAIVALAPDLVVVCVEENRVEDAEALRAAGIELFVFDIDAADDVAPQLQALADRLGVTSEVHVPESTRAAALRAFVPIWRRPWMTLCGATYGSSLLRAVGVANVYADSEQRYPEVMLNDVRAREPQVVLAPSEPYPFTERHRAELETVAPVMFVDGKDLFWWGVRTPDALERLRDQVLRAST
jgi:ABC-type Fe3+-hydroxamate transport system substrate-binding protein